MKNAFRWTISIVGIICLAFFIGLFFGRKSMSAPPVKDEIHAETVSSDIERININTANIEQIQSLPGIGAKLAQRIIDYRTANGPFTSLLQLKLVEGIGDSKLETIIPYIYLEDAK